MEQNKNPIKVQFPKQMKVHSPEIDSIKANSNRISNWLHNDLKNIIEPLTVVRFIPDLIKELKQTIVNQFTNLLLGQVEADVINRQANIKVLNKKIDSTQIHIAQKEEGLNKTIDRLTDRYSTLSDQLNTEHETFLRKLDSHAYDIIEKVYPQQVQEKFSYDSVPGISFLSDHAMISVEDRNICIDKGFKNALKAISHFTKDREQFYNELSEFECNLLDEGAYELPWCFVEMENNITGETKLECWFECELDEGQKVPALEDLRQEIEHRAEQIKINKVIVNETVSLLDDFLNRDIPELERKRFISDFQPN